MKAPNRAVLVAVIVALASCSSEPNKPANRTCAHLGQRLGETPIKGFIFGSVGAKALIPACPGVEVPIAFIGEEPSDYKQLVVAASQREQVVAFDAVADGFVVQERDGDPVLILMTLGQLREDPAATARANADTP